MLKKYCTFVKLQRFEEDENYTEINYILNFEDLEKFVKCKKEINNEFKVDVTFFEEENIVL